MDNLGASGQSDAGVGTVGVFRAIDVTGFTPATLKDQPAPTMIWAETAMLVIDERYQRSLTPKGRRLIQRIADDWDWTKFQPILIAGTTDGRYAVVDGQHRAHAAALCGLTSLPAMVVPMTPVQQAEAFRAVNSDRVRLGAAALFKAQLAAGDPVAVEADRVVAEAGCRLMTWNPVGRKRRPGQIFAYALIMGMVENGEGEAVSAGLRAILDSDQGNGEGADIYGFAYRVWDTPVLHAWLPAIASSQRFLRLPLSKVFDAIDWEQERDTASAWVRLKGGSVRAALTDRVTAVLREWRDAA